MAVVSFNKKKKNVIASDAISSVGGSSGNPIYVSTTKTGGDQVSSIGDYVGTKAQNTNTAFKTPYSGPKFDSKMYQNSVATAQPSSWLANPTKRAVASSITPVVDRTQTNLLGGSIANYQDIEEMDEKKLRDYIDWATINGINNTPEEQFRLMKAGQKLQDLYTQKATVNPYDDIVKQEEIRRMQLENDLKRQEIELMKGREREVENQYREVALQADESAQKQGQAVQDALSFSGFGRSTFNAAKQAEIQGNAEAIKKTAFDARTAELERYKAELAGATREQLAIYDNYINNLKTQSAQYAVSSAEQLNQMNMENAVSYQEKVDNILALSYMMQQQEVPLSDEDMMLAASYGQLLIDDNGKINTELLKSLPPNISGEALKQAAIQKGARGMEAPQTINTANGAFYWDKESGQYVPIEGTQKQKEYGTWKYNPDTKKYERTNPDTGELETQSGPDGLPKDFKGKSVSQTIMQGNVEGLASSMEYNIPYDCGDRNECGEWYNDAVGGKNNTRVGDSYESKLKHVDQSITQGEAGMGVVFNPGGEGVQPYGHIGVLASGAYWNEQLQAVGYDVISANLSAKGKLTKEFITEAQIANSGGGFIPTKVQQGGGGVLGSLGVPITFERSVKALIPATLMNSELELTNLNDTIKRMHESGMTDKEAALTFMGFNVTGENAQLASNLVDVARSLPEDLAPMYVKSISDFVNSGNLQGAVKKAENTAYQQAKKNEGDNYISDAKVRTATGRAKEIAELIDQLEQTGENPIGLFKGTLEKWLKKFKSKEAQEIATKVANLTAPMRNDIVGTQATAGESTYIAPLIPELNDSASNFATKLNNLRYEPLRELNNIRMSYGLPELDEESLLNDGLRVNLYKGSAFTQPQASNKQSQSVNRTDEDQALYNQIFGG